MVLLAATSRIDARTRPVTQRAVFELTSENVEVWDEVFDDIETLERSLSAGSIEVVVHGKAIGMLTRAKSADPVRERIKQSAERGVVLKACERSMKQHGLDKKDLVPFARTVASGIAEVVQKQDAGWAYVRVGS